MLALPLLSLFIIALILALAIGGILAVNTYAGGVFKKDPAKPWAVVRPGWRIAYYASEAEARDDAKDNLVRGGRGRVLAASELKVESRK